jgi:hypothetical protein
MNQPLASANAIDSHHFGASNASRPNPYQSGQSGDFGIRILTRLWATVMAVP